MTDSDAASRTTSDGHAVLAGRYKLSRRLGAGAVAEVWAAVDLRLDRDVAVKLVAGPSTGQHDRQMRLEREARALAAVSHPNVVGVFDYGIETISGLPPVPYVVLELVDGPDLARRLATSDQLPVHDAVGLLQGILAGVAQAHAIGIVHGDLKPANVLLADDGPKVADFGVARILGLQTGTTAPIATPAYAAPEVLLGQRPTPASDVYSAGCIGFEMLTGRRPYTGTSISELMDQQQAGPPPPLRTIRRDVSGSLDEALRRALDPHPSCRHPSADAFAIDLGRMPRVELPAEIRRSVRVHQPSLTAGRPPAAGPAAASSSGETADPSPVSPAPAPQTQLLTPAPTQTLAPRAHRGGRVDTATRWTVRRLRTVPPGFAIAVAGVLLLASMSGHAAGVVPVPDLVGQDARVAAALARDAGLEATTTTVEQAGVAGTVVDQDPPHGQPLPRGSTVVLVVTAGVPQVSVPDVAGLTTTDAMRVLSEHGLVVGDIVYEPVSGADPDRVIASRPPAGAAVDAESQVHVVSAAIPPDASEPAADGEDGAGDRRGRGQGRGQR